MSSMSNQRWAHTTYTFNHIVTLKVFPKVLGTLTTSYIPIVNFLSLIIGRRFDHSFSLF